MIDFATLQGLTIPEGVVVKIESDGAVLWELGKAGPIALQVQKITSNTHAGEIDYNNEQFILLNIYPKSGGTVSVTYGGLTKTITNNGSILTPNAVEVFFGTFEGVADDVETPESGTLTIEGDCRAFGVGMFTKSKNTTAYWTGLIAIKNFRGVEAIPENGFRNCLNLTNVVVPAGVLTISNGAFQDCTNLESVHIPASVTHIATRANQYTMTCSAFHNCSNLERITIDSDNISYSEEDNIIFSADRSTLVYAPKVSGDYNIPECVSTIGDGAFDSNLNLNRVFVPASVTSIGLFAFYACSNITEITFEDPTGWQRQSTTELTWSDVDVSDPAVNATSLCSTSTNVKYQKS